MDFVDLDQFRTGSAPEPTQVLGRIGKMDPGRHAATFRSDVGFWLKYGLYLNPDLIQKYGFFIFTFNYSVQIYILLWIYISRIIMVLYTLTYIFSPL